MLHSLVLVYACGTDTIRVGTSVGHREKTWSGVLSLEILVCKLLTVDGLAASALPWF